MMTEWKKVQGSQATRPNEIDTTTSAMVVYQRRNIKRITTGDSDGNITELWQYEERQMSCEEYTEMLADRLAAVESATLAMMMGGNELV